MEGIVLVINHHFGFTNQFLDNLVSLRLPNLRFQFLPNFREGFHVAVFDLDQFEPVRRLNNIADLSLRQSMRRIGDRRHNLLTVDVAQISTGGGRVQILGVMLGKLREIRTCQDLLSKVFELRASLRPRRRIYPFSSRRIRFLR